MNLRDPKTCCPFENLDLVGLSNFGLEWGLGRVSLMTVEDVLLGGFNAGVAGFVFTPGLTIGLRTDEENSGRQSRYQSAKMATTTRESDEMRRGSNMLERTLWGSAMKCVEEKSAKLACH